VLFSDFWLIHSLSGSACPYDARVILSFWLHHWSVPIILSISAIP